MATTTVSDHVIWAKHIHDDTQDIAERLLGLWAGQTIELEVNGVRGTWRKMEDGADGRATPGIRPVGSAQDAWRDLFRHRRGEIVSLNAVEAYGGVSEASDADRRARLVFPPLGKTEAERKAALEEFLALGREGHWCSDGPYGPRDELYDRE
jgi:hypothetical protein